MTSGLWELVLQGIWTTVQLLVFSALLGAAVAFWSDLTAIPISQFHKPYRAVVDATRRSNRHEMGCVRLVYSDSLVHRRVMAMIAAVTSRIAIPG